MLISDLYETILYRGDASPIDKFDIGKAGSFLLFTPGTYLTDSPEVAHDYTLKGSEHEVFRDDEAKDLKTFVLHYLGHLMVSRTDWKEVSKDIFNRAQRSLYDDPEFKSIDYSKPGSSDLRQEIEKRYQAVMTLETEKLRGKYLKKSKAIYMKDAANLRLVRLSTGAFSLVKADRPGHISRFDIPDSYLAKTLHAERAMPANVLAAMRNLIAKTYVGKDFNIDTQPLDMRDRNGKFSTFDNWVKAYGSTGISYAWDEDGEHNSGKRGELPDLDTLWHGTHLMGSWFYNAENMNSFIKAMQGLGYVGLEYDGGKRVGQHIRGGGGVKHRAFVFWNDDDINRFRINTTQVQDTEQASGLEKGARNSTVLRNIVNTLTV